ncbi:hypothetical protein CLIB1423_01S07492 [[Candida] railenensis]|uniref:Gfd2/YDR514C-like C-terminal domain-containing protein n=1 Tax=[Candida] railenensis TaxID=45579 RepID=A0A9P0VVI6_9ASCO|nr:hypothetical protein CLIB1423_01S07492 [[Candida] railenensis]
MIRNQLRFDSINKKLHFRDILLTNSLPRLMPILTTKRKFTGKTSNPYMKREPMNKDSVDNKIVKTTSSTTENANSNAITSLFSAKIDQYFTETKFRMNKDQQKVLKSCMEKVYTRKSPLFCFDVEAWESNNNLVTEVGISIYDPRERELSLLPNIKSYHIIIEEHRNKRNGKFVPDNKHNFVGGTSHVLSEVEAQKFINKMIHKYFLDDPQLGSAFVGHHIGGDIKWLKTIGVQFPDECPIIDTYRIFQLSHGKYGGGLRSILRLAEIPHAYLHNAANDAYYTLLAALAWCDPSVRKARELDLYVIPEVVQNPRKTKVQQQEDRRAKRQEKFTDIAKRVNVDSCEELL